MSSARRSRSPPLVSLDDFQEAIRMGFIVDVKRMLKEGIVPDQNSVSIAIQNGWPKSFIQLCYKRGASPTTQHLYYAIRYGHIDLVRSLLRMGIVPSEEHLLVAIKMNYKPIIQLLLKQVTPTERSLLAAISVENKSLVRYLLQQDIQPTFTHLEVAEMLRNRDLVTILTKYFIPYASPSTH